MEIGILGPMRVPGGASLGPTQRRLLARLAVRAGEVVPTEQIAEDLGVTPPSVRTAVSRLRKIVGDAISAEPPGYVLAPDALDATRFERHAASIEGRPAAEALRSADTALGFWRGPALVEFDHEEWAIGRAAGLNEQRWGLVEDRIAALIQLGRVEEAIAAAERLTGDQPLRERPVELLMTALVADGRRTEALRAFQRHRSHLAEEAGTEPSSSLVAFDAEIASGHHPTGNPAHTATPVVPTTTTAQGRISRPPRPVTPWIGPTDEVVRISNDLQGAGLITLIGPGGIGKTRLALEVAQRVADGYPGGTCFVDLSVVDDDGAVAAVATALAVQPQPGSTLAEAIVDWANGRRLCLVLDNCEHVVTPMAGLVRAVIEAVPTVSVLATSREPLGIAGENVVPVAPIPADVGVELFLSRARASGADLSDDDRSLVADLCEQLDGMPLAIELASSRARTLALPDLLARLDDRLRLLRAPSNEPDARHRTLRDVVDWSYQLLDPIERTVLERTSVFASGFDLDACRAVVGGPDVDPGELLDSLIGLADKSMLQADRSGSGTRFGMLETVRLFAKEKLAERDELSSTRDRLVDHMVRFTESTMKMWASPRQVEADVVFDTEWGNVRAALARATENNDLDAARRLVLATGPTAFCRLRHEHAAWAEDVLDRDPTDAEIAGIATRWAWAQLDHPRLIELAHLGMEAAPPPDPAAATCRSFLAMLYLVTGRLNDAAALLPALRSDLDNTGDPYVRVLVLFPLALRAATVPGTHEELDAIERILDEAGRVGAPSLLAPASFFAALQLMSLEPVDVEAIERHLASATEHARAAQDAVWEVQALNVSAQAAVRFRSPDAIDACRRVLDRAYDTRFWVIVAQAAPVALAALAADGCHDAAATIVGALGRHFPVLNPLAREICDQYIAEAEQREDGAAAIARGAAMNRDEMVHFILAELRAAARTND